MVDILILPVLECHLVVRSKGKVTDKYLRLALSEGGESSLFSELNHHYHSS